MTAENTPILVFDMETTGFKAGHNDAIQVAAVLLRGSDLAEIGSFCSLMRPERPENASPEALAIHGYTLEHLATCPPPRDVYRSFYALAMLASTPPQLAGHNVDFDMTFLRDAEQAHGFTLRAAPIRPLDTCVSSRIHLEARDRTPDAKLGTVAAAYGIEFQAHDALSDVRATAAILRYLRDENPELYRQAREGRMVDALLDAAGDSSFVASCRAAWNRDGKLWPKQYRALVAAADKRAAGVPA